jgi:hypothetical protein
MIFLEPRLLATAMLVTICTAPALAECDYFSYWETETGDCLDLTVLSETSPDPSVPADQIEVADFRLIPNDFGVNVQGNIKNVSDWPVDVLKVGYSILEPNGETIYSSSFIVSTTVAPRQSIAMQDFIFQDDLTGHDISRLRLEPLDIDYE